MSGIKKNGGESGYSISDLGAKKSQYTINKKKKYEEEYNEDYFEYRSNKDKVSYHLYCPYTGETILNASDTFFRSSSFWGQIDGEAYSRAQNTVLYPEVYASRIWGRRKFNGFKADSDEGKMKARIHIQAIARGFLARLWLRNYFYTNYQKILDIDSLFYYFVHVPSGVTSWQKPRLANNTGIPIVEPDRFQGYSNGPAVARAGIGKANIKRANYLKEKSPEKKKVSDDIPPVDFDNDSYMTIQYWLDGYVEKMPQYKDCVLAYKVDSWSDLYHQVSTAPDDQITQFYCIYKASCMKVNLDVSGILNTGCADFFNYLLLYLKKGLKIKYGAPIMQYVCYAILNIIEQHAGRHEFFRTDEVTSKLDSNGGTKVRTTQDTFFENAMIEKYIEARLDLFCKYLTRIPVEIDVEHLGVGAVEVATPTSLGCEMVELIVSCIALLAHYKLYREITAYYCTKYILQVMKICSEQMHILCLCLKALYNFVYWCESAHMYLLEGTDVMQVLHELRMGGFGSEPEIQRDCRKLELALQADGWRGNVENKIGKEMNEERAQLMYISDKEKYFENLHSQKILDFEIKPGSEYDLPYVPQPKHFEPAPVTSRSNGKYWIKSNDIKIDQDRHAAKEDPLILNTVPVTSDGRVKNPPVVVEKKKDTPPKPKIPRHMVRFLDMLKEVSRLGPALYFITPVDPIALGIPDYPSIVTQPMDLSTVRNNFEKGNYNTPDEFADHMRLIFKNAFAYYKASDNKVNKAAREMTKLFEEKFRTLVRILDDEGVIKKKQQALDLELQRNGDAIDEEGSEDDKEEEDRIDEPSNMSKPKTGLDIFQQAALPNVEKAHRATGIMLGNGHEGPMTLGDIKKQNEKNEIEHGMVLDKNGFIKLNHRLAPKITLAQNHFGDTDDGVEVGGPPKGLLNGGSKRGANARPLFTPALVEHPKLKSIESKLDIVTKRNNSNLKR